MWGVKFRGVKYLVCEVINLWPTWRVRRVRVRRARVRGARVRGSRVRGSRVRRARVRGVRVKKIIRVTFKFLTSSVEFLDGHDEFSDFFHNRKYVHFTRRMPWQNWHVNFSRPASKTTFNVTCCCWKQLLSGLSHYHCYY